jgi:hypothetical protein
MVDKFQKPHSYGQGGDDYTEAPVSRKWIDRQRRTDEILKELGYAQEKTSNVPRVTRGINVIPIFTIHDQPIKAHLYQGDSDDEATRFFSRADPPPLQILRYKNYYYMEDEGLPEVFKKGYGN